MLLNRFSLQLLILFLFCTFSSAIAYSDEKLDDQLVSVMKKWSDAVAKIETIDAKIKQWSYNNTWKVVDCREGRIYFEKSGNCSFKTTSVADSKTREEQRKEGFELFDPTTRHFIWFDKKSLWIDHKKQQVSSYDLERLEEQAEATRQKIARIKNEGTFWERLMCPSTTFIDCISSPKNYFLPILLDSDIAALQERFTFKVVSVLKTNEVYLSAVPKLESDKLNFERIDILIDSETNRPSAVQVITRGGKERTISQLLEVRLNEKPTDCEQLLKPKLDGYSRHEEK